MQTIVDECCALSEKNGQLREENARLTQKYEAVVEERDDLKKKCQAESCANAEPKQSNVELMEKRDQLLLEVRQLQGSVAQSSTPTEPN